MIESVRSEIFPFPVEQVFRLVTDFSRQSFRSDLLEAIPDGETRFTEISKDGFETRFEIAEILPNRLCKLKLENKNIVGDWIGEFFSEGGNTRVSFTERVKAKNPLLNLLLKPYLKKQQARYFSDLRAALNASNNAD